MLVLVLGVIECKGFAHGGCGAEGGEGGEGGEGDDESGQIEGGGGFAERLGVGGFGVGHCWTAE